MATNPNQHEPITISDEEWAQMQRDAQAETPAAPAEQPSGAPAEAAPSAPAAQTAPATAEAKEWNAREWLNEAFKDDPGFKDLSAEDMARLESLANEKREEFAGDIRDWANEKGPEWSGGMKDAIREGMDSSAKLEGFFESRLADGDFSEADQAALKEAAEGMTAAEGAGVVRPIVEEMREINGELIDGVEMIIDHAVDDVHEIVEARAEMPGGDHESVQKLLHDLEEAPDKIHDALDWEREQADIQFNKIDDRLELIEAGADPADLPPDTDTYQVDDNSDHYETEAA